MINRRQFVRFAALSGAVLAPGLQAANTQVVPAATGINGRVVVVGGGMGGVTAAKYLRHWGGDGIDVTLVEPNGRYVSNILSNGVIDGSRTLDSLRYGYRALQSSYGVRRKRAEVVEIDRVSRQVVLSDGSSLSYDRLVLSPGISFDDIAGLESEDAQKRIPHAWQAGVQSNRLRNQLSRLKPGKVFVITIPKSPYRCPPGPYERACVVADYIQRNRIIGAKVVVLDANYDITAGKENFQHAFENLYSDVIEYHPGVDVISIDADRRRLDTSMGEFRAQIINAIPAQQAGRIIADAGLASSLDGRWAGVDMQSYQSTVDPNIYVIGDAAATTQPKAGHIANAEAKVCVDAIIRSLQGLSPTAVPVTNSSCYTPITHDTAAWLSVVYRYDPSTQVMVPSGVGGGASDGYDRENFQEMLHWFENLMRDSFS